MTVYPQRQKSHSIRNLVFIVLFTTVNGFAAGLSFKKITSSDGLSNSAISVIHKDSSGIMWFGTWDGLNAYDGKNIYVYKSDKKKLNTITSNVIVDIVEPEKGILWISTTNGVNKLNTATRDVQRYFVADSKNASTSTKTYKLVLGPENTVICYTFKNKFYYFGSENTFKELVIKQLENKKIRELTNDVKGTLFAITENGELYRIMLKAGKKNIDVLSCVRVLHQFVARNIYKKSETEFWLTDRNQHYVYLFNSTNSLIKEVADLSKLPANGSIQTINEFNNELIVGLATTGLFNYNQLKNSWTPMQNGEYQGGALSSFYDKNQQILWIGSNSNGVIESYREQLNFKCLANNKFSEKHASAVRAINEDKFQRIWVGSRGNGLSILSEMDFGTEKISNIPAFINKSILSLSQGPGNIMFVGTEADGVFLVNSTTFRVDKLNINFAPNSGLIPPIYDLLWDQTQSTLWIGTNTDGAFQLKLNSKSGKLVVEELISYRKENEKGLKNNNVYSIIPFDTDRVLISTRGAGIYVVNAKTHRIEKNINQESPSPLSDNDVLCLAQSSDGSFWAGTSYGLNQIQLKNNNFYIHHFTETKGLPNNTVHGILEDGYGVIWISTNNGLCKVNPKTNEITNYNNGYGLQSNEFSDGAYFKSTKGEMFFGGINGLNHFFISEFEERSYTPDIIINDIKINNTSYPLSALTKTDRKGNYIALKHNQNFFDINFIALDYINNSNCEYAYILEGFNDDWVLSGTSNNAIFTNVTPGDYVLKIKATNGDKIWSNNILSIRVRIENPWWVSWYAFLFYFIIASVLAYVIYSVLKKRIQLNKTIFEERVAKKEQLITYEAKLRFFTNIAHEFCTPLTLIYGPCEKILESEELTGANKKYLHIIKNNAERMQRLINDLMDFRKAETDNKKLIFEKIDIPELLRYMADSFTEFSEQKHIDYTQTFSTSEKYFISDRDALEKIMFNLISNAYKYTNEGGKISIHIDIDTDQIKFIIRNTGKGIKQEDIPNIFNRFQILDNFERNAGEGRIQRNGIGLALTKSLVKLLDGNIQVESIENDYTEFSVTLPAKNNIELKAEIQTTDISKQDDQSIINFRDKRALILIVDDENEIRHLLKDILSQSCDIIEAADGLQAIELLKNHRPDLIISDILMPNMNGVELLNEIKNSRLTSHIPVIFLSSKSTMDDQIANYQRGLEFFISKPFNPKYLLSVVGRILNNRDSLKQYFNSSLSSIEEFNGNFVHSDEKKFLITIAEIITNNMENEQLGADLICSQMNITRIMLYRRMKELANTTPTEFIRHIRLKEAERLVKSTKLTIQEIIYQTGFNNKSYFYSIFKAEYGVSPIEYRKNNIN